MSTADRAQIEKLEEQARIGAEAERVLRSEVFEAAITAPELEIIRHWLRTKPEEKQEREDLYFEARALAKVRKRLTNAVATGKSATNTLEDTE